jgi:glutamate 5-kinase
VADAIDGVTGTGTVIVPRGQRLAARKLWIAFAVGSSGTVVVDAGARQALEERGVSLLPAGVVDVQGGFDVDDAVEIAGPDGVVFAKGLVRHPAQRVKELAGRRTSALPTDLSPEVVHRDDLVLLP